MPTHNSRYRRAYRGRFVGVSEIGKMAGVTRARAGQIVQEAWFPDYVEALDMGTLWDRQQVADALAVQGYPRQIKRPLEDVQAA